MGNSMESRFPAETLDRIRRCGVIAVLVVDEAENAVPLAKALLACGIDVMEVTLRTDSAIEALRLVRQHVPEVLVGSGTILRADQLDAVVDAGAAFGVARGLNPNVVRRANEIGLPFAPGVATPSDIEAAIELGCRELTLFPAQASGGIKYLRSLSAPYAHLDLQFIPSGGIKPENILSYLYDSAVLAVGSSGVAHRKLIQTQDWSAVIDHATEARRIVEELHIK